ncbi:MAG: hypothetical protein LBS44_04690 [Deltaproteobacteria bacterium]|nr:hypothetical protein [Deltaproteobacteria bacterium]
MTRGFVERKPWEVLGSPWVITIGLVYTLLKSRLQIDNRLYLRGIYC